MRQGQTKRDSLLEATVNILIGYGVAIAAQKIIFPMFGMHVSTADDCKIAGLFTIVSLIRSYVLRRAFNWWHVYKQRPRLSEAEWRAWMLSIAPKRPRKTPATINKQVDT